MILHPTQTTVTMMSKTHTATSASPKSQDPEAPLFTIEVFLMILSALWLAISRFFGIEVRLVDGENPLFSPQASR